MNLLKEANELRKEINPSDYRLSDKKTRKLNGLTLLAILLMVIDHIGAIIFPEIEILRWIGRLSFPIFAYQLSVGYQHTSNVSKYLFRLWIFAIIAQIPYTIAFDTFDLNILFTFLLSLYLIDRFAKKEYYWIVTVLAVLFFVNVDYEWYGVLLPVVFYLTRNKKWLGLLIGVALTAGFSYHFEVAFQLLAILGIIIALYVKPINLKIQTSRYFFYWFYPVHLAVIFGIKWILILWLT